MHNMVTAMVNILTSFLIERETVLVVDDPVGEPVADPVGPPVALPVTAAPVVTTPVVAAPVVTTPVVEGIPPIMLITPCMFTWFPH